MKNYERLRLHKAITEIIKAQGLDYTKNDIQQNITRLGVLVNGNMENNRLAWVFRFDSFDFKHWPLRDHGNFDKIDIVYENIEYMVISKPKGVIVQPGAGHQKHNLKVYLEEYKGHELFLVNRLDKDTQGLMLIAKSEEIQEYLQNQFRQRTVKKSYLSILSGFLPLIAEVKGYQSRNLNNPMRQEFFWNEEEAMKYSSLSRNCHSIFEPLAYCEETNETIVKVDIKTGRMHQIRLHAEAIDHPLSFEQTYNKSKPRDISKTLVMDNQVKSIQKDMLLQFRKEVFEQSDYCLLSNSIQFRYQDKIQSFTLINKTKLSELLS